MREHMKDPARSRRFWSKVRKLPGRNACWVWTSPLCPNGYGNIKVSGRNYRAHRLSWLMENGKIPKGLEVCHTCDRPACVRPSHLFVGTRAENMRDCVRKGRHKYGYSLGQAHGMSVLSASDVTAIRQEYAAGDVTQRELGKAYGVGQQNISDIVNRAIWRHLP